MAHFEEIGHFTQVTTRELKSACLVVGRHCMEDTDMKTSDMLTDFHCVQMVWKSTTDIGCATAQCTWKGRDATYLVCRYSPAGNVLGQFADTVVPLRHMKNIKYGQRPGGSRQEAQGHGRLESSGARKMK
eukprot:775098-Pelagomonas_calceolata.AAC.1